MDPFETPLSLFLVTFKRLCDGMYENAQMRKPRCKVTERMELNFPLLLLTGDYGSSRDPSGRSYTTHASESAGEFELLCH